MSIYRALGKALVSQEEFASLSPDALARLASGKTVGLEHGAAALAAPVAFTPIGLNLPLTVQIRHIYTGRHPKKPRNMLVTSAMKSLAQFDAAPRAINFITSERVAPQSDVTTPAATEQGTPLVYYSPALTKGASVITFELGFDDFDPSFLESIGGLLKGAAGIPAFVAHSTYLVGAGMLTKLAANIASRFLEKGPVFRVTDPIDFITAGVSLPEAGPRLIVEADFPKSVLTEYHVQAGTGQLVNAQGARYKGEWPYLMIILNGAAVDEYKAFEPTQASAAILQDLFNVRDGQDTTLGVVLEGLKLYNDLKFRVDADDLKKKLDKATAGSEEAKKLQARYDALVKNILQDELKP